MGAVDDSDIRLALRARFYATPDAPAQSNFAVENRSFTPPNPPALWVKETLLIGSEKKVASRTVELAGIVQYDVMVPRGRGTEAAEDFAKALTATFEPGADLDSPLTRIYLDRSERSDGRVVDAVWWAIAVSISWRAYATTQV